jgi:hypothetical protein
LVSQPLSAVGKAGCVQLPLGATQVELHVPALHESVCTPVLLHARPQPPQWVVDVLVLVSQPSSADGKAG